LRILEVCVSKDLYTSHFLLELEILDVIIMNDCEFEYKRLYYLVIIPRTLAENWEGLREVAVNKISEEPLWKDWTKFMTESFRILFHIKMSDLWKVELDQPTFNDGSMGHPKAYFFTDCKDYHEKYVFDNYFIIREICKKKSYFIEYSYHGRDLGALHNTFAKLDRHKLKPYLKGGKYYIIYNYLTNEYSETKNNEEALYYDGCKRFIRRRKLLSPEIKVLYSEGYSSDGKHDSLLWESFYSVK